MVRRTMTVCFLGAMLFASNHKDADASSANTSRLGECMKLGMTPILLMPITMKGAAAATTPDDRIKVAKSLEDMIPKVNEQNVKDDLRTIADDIRRQAHQPRMVDDPQSVGALKDIKAWDAANCGKDKFPELHKWEQQGRSE